MELRTLNIILHPFLISVSEIFKGGVILTAFFSYNNQNKINPLSNDFRTNWFANFSFFKIGMVNYNIYFK